jgi:hypothetical protein
MRYFTLHHVQKFILKRAAAEQFKRPRVRASLSFPLS